MPLSHELLVEGVEHHHRLFIAVPGGDLIERKLQGFGEVFAVLCGHHPVELQVLLVAHDDNGGLFTPAAPLGARVDVVDEETQPHDLIEAAPVCHRVDHREAVTPFDLLLYLQGILLLPGQTSSY